MAEPTASDPRDPRDPRRTDVSRVRKARSGHLRRSLVPEYDRRRGGVTLLGEEEAPDTKKRGASPEPPSWRTAFVVPP